MDLSQIANIIEVISFVIAIFVWTWKKIKVVKQKLVDHRNFAEELKLYAQQILNKTTSDESRADIYALITYRQIKWETEDIRLVISVYARLILFVILITLVNKDDSFIGRFLWAFGWGCLISLVGDLIISAYFKRILVKNWNVEIYKGLSKKVHEHFDKPR